jgi:hypothetical protein
VCVERRAVQDSWSDGHAKGTASPRDAAVAAAAAALKPLGKRQRPLHHDASPHRQMMQPPLFSAPPLLSPAPKATKPRSAEAAAEDPNPCPPPFNPRADTQRWQPQQPQQQRGWSHGEPPSRGLPLPEPPRLASTPVTGSREVSAAAAATTSTLRSPPPVPRLVPAAAGSQLATQAAATAHSLFPKPLSQLTQHPPAGTSLPTHARLIRAAADAARSLLEEPPRDALQRERANTEAAGTTGAAGAVAGSSPSQALTRKRSPSRERLSAAAGDAASSSWATCHIDPHTSPSIRAARGRSPSRERLSAAAGDAASSRAGARFPQPAAAAAKAAAAKALGVGVGALKPKPAAAVGAAKPKPAGAAGGGAVGASSHAQALGTFAAVEAAAALGEAASSRAAARFPQPAAAAAKAAKAAAASAAGAGGGSPMMQGHGAAEADALKTSDRKRRRSSRWDEVGR